MLDYSILSTYIFRVTSPISTSISDRWLSEVYVRLSPIVLVHPILLILAYTAEASITGTYFPNIFQNIISRLSSQFSITPIERATQLATFRKTKNVSDDEAEINNFKDESLCLLHNTVKFH